MGNVITLTAADGHTLSAYLAEPVGSPRAAIVVVQEIFGVNAHIRNVADRYASAGYAVIAPALFDRVERGVELGYDEAQLGRAFELRRGVSFDQALLDVEAAVNRVGAMGKVGIVGYCWGGTIAWLAAARVAGVAAVVAYYGGGMAQFAAEQARCPVQLHFGEKDKHIPMSDVDAMRHATPAPEVYTYAADHGFNCDARASYDAAAAQLARDRALKFFAQKLG